LALVAAASIAALLPAQPTAARGGGSDPHAVVAVVDTGINPYHETFRDKSVRAYKHPSTYIPGYPKDAKALRLTFVKVGETSEAEEEKKYWDAVKADCERVWSKIEPGKLYWFPGTKIVGGITFEEAGELNCSGEQPAAGGRILDAGGHGTMTASRATSTEYGACKECHVVAVQFPTSIPFNDLAGTTQPAVDAITWAADNADWVDAQSNSWGPFVPGWDPSGQAGLLTANPSLIRAVEEVSSKHLAFWASGNGAAFRGGAVGHPTLATPHLTPSALIVGGLDSGYVNTWPGFPPHVVSDSCSSWAAYHTQISRSADDVGGGTSGATPFAAGGAARILLEARRILGDSGTGVTKDVVASGPAGLVKDGPLKDGKFTLEEWRRTLYVTATPRPKATKEDGAICDTLSAPYSSTPVKWEDVPDEYPEFLHIGYGAIDGESHALAMKVINGAAPPDRSRTDQYFAVDHQLRTAMYEVFSKP
jgi:hypothetical protein